MPVVIRHGHGGFSFAGATETVIVSCDLVALEITADTEMIDIGTMCDPGAQDVGRTVYSAVVTLLPTKELHEELSDHIGEAGSFALAINDDLMPTTNHGRVSFQTRYSALPWGRFEIGQRIEADFPIAVLSTPVWDDTPTTPLAASTKPAPENAVSDGQ